MWRLPLRAATSSLGCRLSEPRFSRSSCFFLFGPRHWARSPGWPPGTPCLHTGPGLGFDESWPIGPSHLCKNTALTMQERGVETSQALLSQAPGQRPSSEH